MVSVLGIRWSSSSFAREDRSAVNTRNHRSAAVESFTGGWKFLALRQRPRMRGAGGVPEHGFYFCAGVDFGKVDAATGIVEP